jgi:uncharacterized membrane protein
MATSMSANVFFWIIPGQRAVVADLKAGKPVDPLYGKRGKQRSVHNTYFTLPVVFAMLSNHYSFTYNHPQNWLVLILMMFAGAAIRQFFVLRHGFKLGRNRHPWAYAAIGVAAIVGVLGWLRPATVGDAVAIHSGAASTDSSGASDAIGYKTIQAVLEQRCYMCHGPLVQMKNVRLDSPEGVQLNARNMVQQAVVTKVMPMNNATHITEAERALIGKWFTDGARVN